jgi:hypothetical protein
VSKRRQVIHVSPARHWVERETCEVDGRTQYRITLKQETDDRLEWSAAGGLRHAMLLRVSEDVR